MYDFSDAKDFNDELIPAGIYKAVIRKIEEKVNDNGTKYFSIGWEIIDGDLTGRWVFGTYTFEDPYNEKRRNVGRGILKRIATAITGQPKFSNPIELIGKPHLVKVKHYEQKDGEKRATVSDAKKIDLTTEVNFSSVQQPVARTW